MQNDKTNDAPVSMAPEVESPIGFKIPPRPAADPSDPGPKPTPAHVIDDGEWVTETEKAGRLALRRQLRAGRRAPAAAKAPPPAEVTAALDQHAPGWRAREKEAEMAKVADKAEKAAKVKADRREASAIKKAAKAAKVATLPAKARRLKTDAKNGTTPSPTAADKDHTGATVGHLAERWHAALSRAGKTETTCEGYRHEIGKAVAHFGAETLVTEISTRKAANYMESDAVTKTRGGKKAAQPGVDKTRRALRLALDFAVAAGWVPANPAAAEKAAS